MAGAAGPSPTITATAWRDDATPTTVLVRAQVDPAPPGEFTQVVITAGRVRQTVTTPLHDVAVLPGVDPSTGTVHLAWGTSDHPERLQADVPVPLSDAAVIATAHRGTGGDVVGSVFLQSFTLPPPWDQGVTSPPLVSGRTASLTFTDAKGVAHDLGYGVARDGDTDMTFAVDAADAPGLCDLSITLAGNYFLPVAVPVRLSPCAPPLFRTAYDPTLYRVQNGTLVALTPADWAGTGYYPPTVVRTRYEKYAWSPAIYATASFPGVDPDVPHELTPGEWAAAGSPSPVTTGYVQNPAAPTYPDSDVTRWSTSDELFLHTPDGALHKLTAAEWAATGHRYFITDGAGYLRLSWDPTVVFSTGFVDVEAVTYPQWAAAQFPTPEVTSRLPGDSFTRTCGSDVVVYHGAFTRAITFAEWQAAGSPAPTRVCFSSSGG